MQSTIMKLKTIILTSTLGGLSLFTTTLHGQTAEMSKSDSLTMYKKEVVQTQKKNDTDRMNSVTNARTETKEKAKEAKRIEQEANAAAQEAKNALKAEKRAQKARKYADAQSQKASKARVKSNEN